MLMCLRVIACAQSLQLCTTLCDPMDSSPPVHVASLSKEFPRQEYSSGLPCCSPGDLPDPGIKPAFLMSLALAGGFFTTSTTWNPVYKHTSQDQWYQKMKSSPVHYPDNLNLSTTSIDSNATFWLLSILNYVCFQVLPHFN